MTEGGRWGFRGACPLGVRSSRPGTSGDGTPDSFQTRIVASALVGFQYDVAGDGRFIINSLPASSVPFTLISGVSTRLKD